MTLFFLSQVDQKVDEAWPLLLLNHEGKKKKVYLEPGEMLFYESAKVPHGRQIPFQGEYFDNMFAHFYPLQYFALDDPKTANEFELK